MSTELRDLFDALVADQPDHSIDLDERIRRGRKLARVRTALTATVASVVTAGVISAGFAFRPAGTDGSVGVAGSPTPTASSSDVLLGTINVIGFSETTEQSTALVDQVRQLVPDLATSPRYRIEGGHAHLDGSSGRRLPLVQAWFRIAGTRDEIHALNVRIGASDQNVQVICAGMWPTFSGPCEAEQVALPDGRQAQVYRYTEYGKERRGVRLVRPDGVQVVIESGMMMPEESTPYAPDLSVERLLEIAQGITIAP